MNPSKSNQHLKQKYEHSYINNNSNQSPIQTKKINSQFVNEQFKNDHDQFKYLLLRDEQQQNSKHQRQIANQIILNSLNHLQKIHLRLEQRVLQCEQKLKLIKTTLLISLKQKNKRQTNCLEKSIKNKSYKEKKRIQKDHKNNENRYRKDIDRMHKSVKQLTKQKMEFKKNGTKFQKKNNVSAKIMLNSKQKRDECLNINLLAKQKSDFATLTKFVKNNQPYMDQYQLRNTDHHQNLKKQAILTKRKLNKRIDEFDEDEGIQKYKQKLAKIIKILQRKRINNPQTQFKQYNNFYF